MASVAFFSVVPPDPGDGAAAEADGGGNGVNSGAVVLFCGRPRFLLWCAVTFPFDLFVRGGLVGRVCFFWRLFYFVAAGWVFSVALDVPWPVCATLLFETMLLSARAAQLVMPRGKALRPVVVAAAGLGWLLLMMLCARRRLRGGVIAVSCMAIGIVAVLGLNTSKQLDSMLPEYMQGMTIPCMVPVFESLAYYGTTLSLGAVAGTSSSFGVQAAGAYAAVVTQTCDCMRLAAFLSLVKVPDAEAMWSSAAMTFVTSVMTDVVSRSMLVWSLLYRLCGWVYVNSPETERLLQSRFVFGYTPFVSYGSFLAATTFASAPQTSTALAGLYVLALMAELASDTGTVLLQQWLAGGSGFWATLRRLNSTGGHVALGALRQAVVPAVAYESAAQVLGRGDSPPSSAVTTPSTSERLGVLQLPGAVEDANRWRRPADRPRANFHSEDTPGSHRSPVRGVEAQDLRLSAAMFELMIVGFCWKVTESVWEAYFGACWWRVNC